MTRKISTLPVQHRNTLQIPQLLKPSDKVTAREPYRFRRKEVGGQFYCAKCRAVHFASGMECFEDKHANPGWSNEWCGACVKEALRFESPGFWREIWADIRAGKTRPDKKVAKVRALPAQPNRSADNTKGSYQGVLKFSDITRLRLKMHNDGKRIKEKVKKEQKPPPELDLVL